MDGAEFWGLLCRVKFSLCIQTEFNRKDLPSQDTNL